MNLDTKNTGKTISEYLLERKIAIIIENYSIVEPIP